MSYVLLLGLVLDPDPDTFFTGGGFQLPSMMDSLARLVITHRVMSIVTNVVRSGCRMIAVGAGKVSRD
ncbi:MAG: hypothetical protein L0219_02485 [Phycisphaerales bacterium]|nr:hypothetical protein [Phycisphaerales bacterium]